MSQNLVRYWIEFEIKNEVSKLPPGIGLGCGVTAFNYEDALRLIKKKIFGEGELPPIKRVQENVDINSLDQSHVTPNMHPPHLRGVWFPLGYN